MPTARNRYSLYAAGSNSHGQLAATHAHDLDRWTRISLDAGWTPTELACGANHSLVVATDRAGETHLVAAGSNARGQLSPRPDSQLRLEFQPLALEVLCRGLQLPHSVDEYRVELVAAAWETSFILLRPRDPADTASDVLVSLGANDWGERGSLDAAQDAPSIVALDVVVPEDERTATTLRVVELAAGPRHVLALVELSTACSAASFSSSRPHRVLLGWGASRHGQLGPAPASSAPVRTTLIPREVPLPAPHVVSDVASIAAGRDHSAMLLRTAHGRESVLLLGSNRHGQLGPPSQTAAPPTPVQQNLFAAATLLPSHTAARIAAVHCTWSSTFLALAPSPSPPPSPSSASQPVLLAFGLNAHGQLGAPSPTEGAQPVAPALPPGRTVRTLAAGSEHVLALLGSGEVWGWGWNEHGNLGREGDGDGLGEVRAPRRVWPPEQVGNGRAVRVWAGMASSWVLVEDLDAGDPEDEDERS